MDFAFFADDFRDAEGQIAGARPDIGDIKSIKASTIENSKAIGWGSACVSVARRARMAAATETAISTIKDA